MNNSDERDFAEEMTVKAEYEREYREEYEAEQNERALKIVAGMLAGRKGDIQRVANVIVTIFAKSARMDLMYILLDALIDNDSDAQGRLDKFRKEYNASNVDLSNLRRMMNERNYQDISIHFYVALGLGPIPLKSDMPDKIVVCMKCGERFESVASSRNHPHFANPYESEDSDKK